MADYGEIGDYLPAGLSTTLSARRPVVMNSVGSLDVYGAIMAADIGEIVGTGAGQLQKHLLAPWAFDYIAHQRERDTLPDTTGAIRGHVEADAERIPFAIVHLYYNPTGEKISTTVANANGEFEFLGLAVGSTQYTVMSALNNYNNARETRMVAVTA